VSVTAGEIDNLHETNSQANVVSTYSMHFIFITLILHLYSQALHSNSDISLDLTAKFKAEYGDKKYML
jgi:hypothetical protein